jgi:pimeloyl-ACP methyl ester carboxylesterase
MAKTRRVVAVDMRNHGDSFWDDDHSYAAMAQDLADVVEAEGNAQSQMDVMGHSMGGKAAMVLALTRPELVRRLIVADIAPVAYTHTHDGLINAMQDLKIEDLTSRTEADRRFSERVRDPGTRAFLLQSLELREGPVRWKLNLDALDAAMDSVVGWPENLTNGRYDGPTLFLYGGNSAYVKSDAHPVIHTMFPHAILQEIEGAGHWLHAEKPREVEAAVETFLA